MNEKQVAQKNNEILINKCKQQDAEIANQKAQLNAMISKFVALEAENSKLANSLKENKQALNEQKIESPSKEQQKEIESLRAENDLLKEDLMKLQKEYLQLNKNSSQPA